MASGSPRSQVCLGALLTARWEKGPVRTSPKLQQLVSKFGASESFRVESAFAFNRLPSTYLQISEYFRILGS